MKIRVTMKDPDTLDDAIYDAAMKEVDDLGLPADEKEEIVEARRSKAREIASQWFRYGEYLTVEIDTEAHTCTVVKSGA